MSATLSAVSGTGMHNYNFETLELLKAAVADAAARNPGTTTHVIEVAFNNLPGKKERDYFNGVKTSINLDDDTVDRLIEVGRRLLRDSKEFSNFLNAVQ